MWMRKALNKLAKPVLGMATGALALGCVWLSSGFVARDVASAQTLSSYNSAKVEALTRPCFGALLDPRMTRSCYGSGYRYPYKYGDGYGYGHGRGIKRTVYCNSKTRKGYLEDVVRRLPPYSELTIVAALGEACEASLRLTKSITLIGKGGSALKPVFKAPIGQSCIRIEPTADSVIIRNMTIWSERGDNSACISSSGKELSFENSQIRYDGEGSAIDVDDGRFNLENSSLIVRTLTAALVVRNAEFYGQNSHIASTFNGLKADLVGDSRLVGLTFLQLGDWQGFERGEDAKAVDISLNTYRSVITLDRLKTLFYGNGLYLEGVGEALVSNSLFYSDHAINTTLERVRILNNFIFADETGIVINKGTAFVGGNHIHLVRTAGIVTKSEAQLKASNNKVFTGKCGGLNWGSVDPAQRTCTAWQDRADFAVPGGTLNLYDMGGVEPYEALFTALCDSNTEKCAKTYEGYNVGINNKVVEQSERKAYVADYIDQLKSEQVKLRQAGKKDQADALNSEIAALWAEHSQISDSQAKDSLVKGASSYETPAQDKEKLMKALFSKLYRDDRGNTTRLSYMPLWTDYYLENSSGAKSSPTVYRPTVLRPNDTVNN